VQREAATAPVDRLVKQRRALQEQIDAAQRGGNTNLAGMLEEELGGVNTALDQAISKAIAFWSAMGGPEAEAAIAKLKGIQITVGDTGRQFLMAGKQINESIANGAASAFDRFAKDIAEGKNVFKSLKDAFLQFAADFPRQIAQMISQQAAFNAVSAAGGGASSSSGGAGGGIAGFAASRFHNGGIVDVANAQRAADLGSFKDAARYHTGGIAGLAPDEVPAILRRDEEVLTRADSRPRYHDGGNGSGETRVVNVFDSAAAIEAALQTPAGGRAILNFVQENPRTFKSAMGG
jgi:hypothetical protein